MIQTMGAASRSLGTVADGSKEKLVLFDTTLRDGEQVCVCALCVCFVLCVCALCFVCVLCALCACVCWYSSRATSAVPPQAQSAHFEAHLMSHISLVMKASLRPLYQD